MANKHTLNYQPLLHVTLLRQYLSNDIEKSSIVFHVDSDDNDWNRSPTSIGVNLNTTDKLSLEFEGLDSYQSSNPAEDFKFITGTVYLVISSAGSTDSTRIVLSNPKIPVSPVTRGTSKKSALFPDIHFLTNYLKSQWLEEFSHAISEWHDLIDVDRQLAYVDSTPTSSSVVVPKTVNTIQSSPVIRNIRVRDESSAKWWKKPIVKIVGWALAIPILFILFILLFNFFKSNPVEQALDNTLINSPEAINQQVQITKDTLSSIGLDPGVSMDLGCLEQP